MPIVSASTAVVAESNEEYIMKVHQGIYNDSSNITLLSEFQLRNAGCIVQSIPKVHATDDNKVDFQDIKVNDVFIPLTLRGCLMIMANRKPTKEDREELEYLEVTLNTPWSPQDHSKKLYNALPTRSYTTKRLAID